MLEVISFSFLFRASVIKEYGVYWDEISVTLNCKSSVFSASLHRRRNNCFRGGHIVLFGLLAFVRVENGTSIRTCQLQQIGRT